MKVKRYYTKGAPVEELKKGTSPSSAIAVDEKTALPEVNERYVKKDKELSPLSFIVIFSGGTDREKDYLDPILKHKSRFPELKLDFLPEPEFKKGNKPAVFDFALEKQKEYQSSSDKDSPDYYFLLTDVDHFGTWITSETPLCNENGIKVLVSNPCFEVWLYYAVKKDKFEGFVPPLDQSQLSKEIKTWCGSAIKGGLQTKKYLFLLEENIKNAKENYSYDSELGYGDMFSTNVFELGEAMLPVVKKELIKLKEERNKKVRGSRPGKAAYE